jgi:hypothetical protein
VKIAVFVPGERVHHRPLTRQFHDEEVAGGRPRDGPCLVEVLRPLRSSLPPAPERT